MKPRIPGHPEKLTADNMAFSSCNVKVCPHLAPRHAPTPTPTPTPTRGSGDDQDARYGCHVCPGMAEGDDRRQDDDAVIDSAMPAVA